MNIYFHNFYIFYGWIVEWCYCKITKKTAFALASNKRKTKSNGMGWLFFCEMLNIKRRERQKK